MNDADVIALKVETYKTMDQECPDRVIFASNTSGMSITETASVTKRADRFVGMHFFQPGPDDAACGDC